MSDLEISGSDSDPVSDVNPEEMARLMADLDDMDNELFKSTLKSGGKGSGGGRSDPSGKEAKDSNKKVTFGEDPAGKAPPDDDDDGDWDADDLLFSDDEAKPQKKHPKKPESRSTSTPSPGKAATSSENKSQVGKIKTEPASPLSTGPSPGDGKRGDVGKSPETGTSRKDKAKLMDDLFGDKDDSKPTIPQGTREVGRAGGRKVKSKDEVMFDEDDDLLGDYGDASKKVASSPKGDNFLSSLLSPSLELAKKEKPPADFVLDSKYKKRGKDDRDSKGGFGSYMPSSSKPNSPRRSPKQSGAGSNMDLDLFSSEPRKRTPRSTPQRKPFDLDDDDILGNVRSRRNIKKEVSPEAAQETTKASKTPAKSGNKDDWLFGSPEAAAANVKKTIDKSSVSGGTEKNEGGQGAKENWLGSMLSTRKKSNEPDDAHVAVTPTSSQNIKRPVSAPDAVPRHGEALGGSLVVHSPETGGKHSPQRASWLPESGLHTTLLKEKEDMAAKMTAQQKQLEVQMAQQLQHQQQLMAEAMKNQMEAAEKRYQESLLILQQPSGTIQVPGNVQYNQGKHLEVDLHTAEVEVARLKAELELVRRQHEEEITMLEAGFRRKLEVEREVWGRVEARLREERDGLLTDFHTKIAGLQEEKDNVATSYQAQMNSLKTEWAGAMERTKELYSSMVQRMKEEHSSTLERLTHLKELEVKAALTASGHVSEAEVVMTQLEANTSELTALTAVINTRNDSALELTQRALKMKEKQLQDFESDLSASRAETECERGRLNTVIHRLESTLVQQGSEVEKERWRLAQERLKVEVERQSLTQERKHLQLSNETERQNLASARENVMQEHQSLLQSVAHQKQDLAAQEAKLTMHQRLATSGAALKSERMSLLETGGSAGLVREEQQLREKLAALTVQGRHLNEKEAKLEDLSFQLEQDKAKVKLEREMVRQEQAALARTTLELERTKEELSQQRGEQQGRLANITAQTRALHTRHEKIEQEHQRLQHLREEVFRMVHQGLCAACQAAGGAGRLLLGTRWHTTSKCLPRDGGEVPTLAPAKADMSPSSVLARLSAARQQQNAHREKRLLQISAMELL